MANDEDDGASGRGEARAPRAKAMWDAFAARSKGMTGEALERELDFFIDEIIERNVAVAPAGIRDDVRETMRSYVEGDPTLVAMVADIRAAARR